MARLVTLSDRRLPALDARLGADRGRAAGAAAARRSRPCRSTHAGISVGQVARRIIAAAGLTVPLPEREPADEERLRELGRELGQAIADRSAEKPFALVVDALDEARNEESPSLDEPRRVALLLGCAREGGSAGGGSVRGRHAPRSPRQPGEGTGGDLLRALGAGPDETIDLGSDRYVDRTAIQRYVGRLLAGEGEENGPPSAALSRERRDQLAEAITTAAADSFLIAAPHDARRA